MIFQASQAHKRYSYVFFGFSKPLKLRNDIFRGQDGWEDKQGCFFGVFQASQAPKFSGRTVGKPKTRNRVV